MLEGYKTIIVCPLDWGLGHTTRCIPIIQELLSQNKKVVFLGEKWQCEIINKEVSNLELRYFPGYRIKYFVRLPVWVGLFLQVLKIIRIFLLEKKIILQIARKVQADVVISDNRPGCFVHGLHNIYITHQLNIPWGNKNRFSPLLTRIHHYLMINFNEIWVPDFSSFPGLSGNLGHCEINNPKIKYIGPLSRFNKVSLKAEKNDFDICFVISGPEPLRSALERNVILQCSKYPDKYFALIRGTFKAPKLPIPSNICSTSFATTSEMSDVWKRSHHIVCSSGYSTLMDLYQVKRSAWLFPTPGQFEQLYLAYLHSKITGFHRRLDSRKWDINEIINLSSIAS